MSLAKGSRIGHYPYRIIEQLGEGEGGMADIYLATTDSLESPSPDQLVVIKIVNTRDEKTRAFYEETLQNEVEILRRLEHPPHPGVVQLLPIKGMGIVGRPYTALTHLPDTPWFFVMEYLAGGSLAELLETQKKLSLRLALDIIQGITEAIDYIHRLGYVHLDLKPENVLFRQPLNQKIEPVLIDFGIARGIGQGGLEAGTLLWCPPERVAVTTGKYPPESLPKPTPAMDVYGLGMLLYHMITGKLPFKKRSRKRTTAAILAGNPTVPSQYEPTILPTLDDLILSALAKEPTQRPTAAEFLQSLHIIIEKYPNRINPTALIQNPSKRRRPWGILVIASGLLIALTGSGILFSQGGLSFTPSPTPSPTMTVTKTATHTPTSTQTPTVSPTKTTARPSRTPTTIQQSTRVPTHTARPTLTPSRTSTPGPTLPPTWTALPTWTTLPMIMPDDG